MIEQEAGDVVPDRPKPCCDRKSSQRDGNRRAASNHEDHRICAVLPGAQQPEGRGHPECRPDAEILGAQHCATMGNSTDRASQARTHLDHGEDAGKTKNDRGPFVIAQAVRWVGHADEDRRRNVTPVTRKDHRGNRVDRERADRPEDDNDDAYTGRVWTQQPQKKGIHVDDARRHLLEKVPVDQLTLQGEECLVEPSPLLLADPPKKDAVAEMEQIQEQRCQSEDNRIVAPSDPVSRRARIGTSL